MPWMSISVLYLLYEATVNIYLFYVAPQYLNALGHSIKENFGVDSLLQISFMPVSSRIIPVTVVRNYHWRCKSVEDFIKCQNVRLRGLTGSALEHRSLPPVFDPRRGHI